MLSTSSGKEGEGPLAGVNGVTKSGMLLSKWKKTGLYKNTAEHGSSVCCATVKAMTCAPHVIALLAEL